MSSEFHGKCDKMKSRIPFTGRLAGGALLSASTILLLWSCSNPVTPGIFYTDHVFRIIATTAYTGELVTDSANTPVSGSSSQDFKFVAVSGQQYSLTVVKTNSDGTPLTVELVADQTIDGTATSVVVQSSTTTSPDVPARVVLLE